MKQGKTNSDLDFDFDENENENENLELMKEHLKKINNDFKKKNSMLTNINFNLRRTRYSPITFEKASNNILILSKWVFANANQSLIKQLNLQPYEVKVYSTPRQLDVIDLTSKDTLLKILKIPKILKMSMNIENSHSSISFPVVISPELYAKEKLDYTGLFADLKLKKNKIEQNKENPTEKELCKFQASDLALCLSSFKDLIIEGGSLGRLERIRRVVIFHLLNYLNLRVNYINFNTENLNILMNKKSPSESKELENFQNEQKLEEDSKKENDLNYINDKNDINDNNEINEINPITALNDDKDIDVDGKKINININEEKNAIKENERFAPFELSTFIPPDNEEEAIEKARDQGFSRAKILILSATKKEASKIITTIVALQKGKWKGLSGKAKFKEEFSEERLEEDDFEVWIGIDNVTETLKLFANKECADIAIMSPLKIKRLLDAKEKSSEIENLLSSIEIMYIDFADQFLLQKIEHIESTIERINAVPNKILSDINRICPIFSEQISKYCRQNIALCLHHNIELYSIFDRKFTNYLGRMIILAPPYPCLLTSLEDSKLSLNIKYIKSSSLENARDTKFNYFIKKIWPEISNNYVGHTAIIVSNYIDFVMLRKFFRENKYPVSFLSEIICNDKKRAQRRVTHYETLKRPFLLLSENAHYLFPFELRFAFNLVFYSPPHFCTSFGELLSKYSDETCKAIINIIKNTGKKIPNIYSSNEKMRNVMICYNDLEKDAISRIVGTANMEEILEENELLYKYDIDKE